MKKVLFPFFVFYILIIFGGPDTKTDLQDVIQKAQENIIALRVNNEYWTVPTYLGTNYISQYYLVLKWLGKNETLLNESTLKEILLKDQLPDGSWYAIKDANVTTGNLDATIFNYWALKVMSKEDDGASLALRKARNYILSHGGLEKAALFTKIFLALFENYPWGNIPSVPFLIFSKNKFFNAFVTEKSFAQWVGPHLIAIAYIKKRSLSKKLGGAFQLFELYKGSVPRIKKIKTNKKWLKEDQGFCHIVEQMLQKQQPKGSWGGYSLSTLLTIISFEDYKSVLSVDDPLVDKLNTAILKAYGFIENLYFNTGSASYKGCLDDGRYWDTVLLLIALLDSGYPKQDIISSGNYLVNVQQKDGGYPYGYDFEYVSDLDDSAEIVIALKKLGGFETQIKKTITWILEMQNNDGGWGAFYKNNTGNMLLRWFTKDFEDSAGIFDKSSVDVTGHILEAFGTVGMKMDDSLAIQKAIAYLKKQQDPDTGAWSARWGINYIYGTSAVIVGLAKVGEDMRAPYVQKALDWLSTVQNPDGGFGESTLSYVDKEWAGIGISTASQTAWAILALVEGGWCDAKVTQRAVHYLIDEFIKNGKWIDYSTVGTGHPRILYMDYPSYPYAFPLIALSQYYKKAFD